MKKCAILVLTFIFIVLSAGFQVCSAQDTSAKAAVVMDVNSGRVLYSKNCHQKMAMASTTKIMTTLVAIESGRLNETVKVSKKASTVEGSSIYLKEGEKLTVEELLYGIMLRSGNDAATAVAEHIGGSVEGFVAMMNKKAKEIGAVDTHFANPHGLDADGHYTTAYDLALITSYALKNPKFAQIVSTKKKSIKGPEDQNWDRALVNKNKMLWNFEGGDGVKTGYTGNAGRCLVSSATRNNWHLVTVVLNCSPMWEESAALLEYGFRTYSNQTLIEKDQVYESLPVKNSRSKYVNIRTDSSFCIPLKDGEKEKIKIVPVLEAKLEAPIVQGTEAGHLDVYLEDVKLGSVKLLFCQNIEPNNPMFYFKKIFSNLNVFF